MYNCYVPVLEPQQTAWVGTYLVGTVGKRVFTATTDDAFMIHQQSKQPKPALPVTRFPVVMLLDGQPTPSNADIAKQGLGESPLFQIPIPVTILVRGGRWSRS